MEKYEMVIETMKLYDENESLKRKLKEMSQELERGKREGERSWYDNIDARMIIEGRKSVFDRSTFSFPAVTKLDGTLTTIEEYTRRIICSIPSLMSKEQFIEYFHDEIEARYEKALLEIGD